MPRSFSNRPSRNSAFSTPSPVRHTPPASTSGSGPSLKDSMKQGFGLGLGLEGARAAIGAVGGALSSDNSNQQPSSTSVYTNNTTNESSELCGLERKLYEKCLDKTGNIDNECKDIFTLYEKCRNN